MGNGRSTYTENAANRLETDREYGLLKQDNPRALPKKTKVIN